MNKKPSVLSHFFKHDQFDRVLRQYQQAPTTDYSVAESLMIAIAYVRREQYAESWQVFLAHVYPRLAALSAAEQAECAEYFGEYAARYLSAQNPAGDFLALGFFLQEIHLRYFGAQWSLSERTKFAEVCVNFITLLQHDWHIYLHPLGLSPARQSQPVLENFTLQFDPDALNEEQIAAACQQLAQKIHQQIQTGLSQEKLHALAVCALDSSMQALLKKITPSPQCPLPDIYLQIVAGTPSFSGYAWGLEWAKLARVIADLPWPDKEQWLAPTCQALDGYLTTPGLPPLSRAGAIMLRLFFRRMYTSPDQAMHEFWGDVHTHALPDSLSCIALLMPLLHDLHLAGEAHQNDLEQFLRACLPELSKLSARLAVVILELAQYGVHSTQEWNALLFYHWAVPLYQNACDDEISLRYWLWYKTTYSYTQQPHTETHLEYCWEYHKPIANRLANQLHANYVTAQDKQVGHNHGVAFITDSNFINHAPGEVIFHLARSLRQAAPDLPLHAYGFLGQHSSSDKYIGMLNELGVQCHLLPERNSVLEDDITQRLLAVKSHMRERNIAMVVFYNYTHLFVTLAAALQLAPVQTIFSMGGEGYLYRSEYLDGYFAMGDDSVHQAPWLGIFGNFYDPTEVVNKGRLQAIEVKKKILAEGNFRLLIGCMARPVKLEHQEFWDAIEQILKANPDVGFLWFGRSENEYCRKQIMQRNLTRQCRFEGWVSTPVYAQILDINLDSFPFPQGFTVFECLCAGTPVVFYPKTYESYLIGVPKWVISFLRGSAGTEDQQHLTQEIFGSSDGKNLFCCANTMEEYISYTLRLVTDKIYRNQVGQAGKRFFQEILREEKAAGNNFKNYYYEIIQKKLQG